MHVSGKLPNPSTKPTFCREWEVSVNVGLGEGYVGSFPETYYDPNFLPKQYDRKFLTLKKFLNHKFS